MSATFVLPDQRALEYAAYGAAAGAELATVIYFHGTPGSHHEAKLLHEQASQAGLRIIAASRPGFAGSSPHPRRTLLSFSEDVLALADHLGIQRFALLGFSGGCPYAFACLYAVPRPRILHTAVVAGAYPFELGTSGMKLSSRALFSLLKWAPGLVGWGFDYFGAGRLARDTAHPERFTKAMKDLFKVLPPEDRVALAVEGGKAFDATVESVRGAFQQGPQASVEDLKLVSSPWGFNLTELKVEKGQLVMWHGAKDVNIPLKMAKKAASMIPGADLRVERDLTHIGLSVLKRGEIIASVAEAVKGL
ncbi:alpha/beta-hydrolase [Hypoxylon sp. FL0543]|nr:alpha/beta-hydrolase [Hypoxylon sp. FL0543]